jgi:hypothetical protein
VSEKRNSDLHRGDVPATLNVRLYGSGRRDETTDERTLALEWGRPLFLRQSDPVRWAAGILEVVQTLAPGIAEVEAILSVARDERRWSEGHGVFDAARRRYLRLAGTTTVEHAVLNFAELVAKVTFNASNTNAPFDENSGWYVGPLAVRIAAAVDRDGFTSRLQEAIGEWPG